MSSVGMPELLAVIGFAVYGVMFFVVWKFYQVLSHINQNIAGIKRGVRHESDPMAALLFLWHST